MTDSERIAWVAAVVLFVGFACAIAIGAGVGSSSRTAYSRGYAAAVDSVLAGWRPSVPADNLSWHPTGTDTIPWAYAFRRDTVMVLVSGDGFFVLPVSR